MSIRSAFPALGLLVACGSGSSPGPAAPAVEVHRWFRSVQAENGLLPSFEGAGGDYAVSLYDQALSAMAFLVMDDLPRAEKVLDFFAGRVDGELKAGKGGYWQFRPVGGVPAKVGTRWLGDNIYLLAAIYNYEHRSGDTVRYAAMREALQTWILALQDTDGGLFAGYTASDARDTLKVTEANIDAFGAVPGYTPFHTKLLGFLESQRWDATDRMLVAWVGSPTWKYSCDNVSWAYCAIEGFPESTFLYAEDHFVTTKTATAVGAPVRGFCFDADRDTVHLEGSMGMTVAYALAGQPQKAAQYRAEAEKLLLPGHTDPSTRGLPYATNAGTSYGDGALPDGAWDRPWVSSSAWYLFALEGFNPFGYARARGVPIADQFWN